MRHEFAKRVDSASTVVKATRATIDRAFIEADAVASWLPPKGMKGHVEVYEPRSGGTYRMVLAYDQQITQRPARGRSTRMSCVAVSSN